MIAQVGAAIADAKAAASKFGTHDLRARAAHMGWSPEAVKELKVTPDLDIELGDQAADLEYGTQDSPPLPAVRQYKNRTQNLEAYLLRYIESRLQGVI